MKEISRHFVHYFTLVGLLSVAFFGLIRFEYNPIFQSAIAVSLCVSFVVWGIVHHHLHGDLNTKIVLEYVSMSVLVLTILLLVL